MGLVGTISAMLLHDRFVESPSLKAQAEPTRVVVGDRVRPGSEPAFLLAGAG
jgi:hypothetical protein